MQPTPERKCVPVFCARHVQVLRFRPVMTLRMMPMMAIRTLLPKVSFQHAGSWTPCGNSLSWPICPAKELHQESGNIVGNGGKDKGSDERRNRAHDNALLSLISSLQFQEQDQAGYQVPRQAVSHSCAGPIGRSSLLTASAPLPTSREEQGGGRS